MPECLKEVMTDECQLTCSRIAKGFPLVVVVVIVAVFIVAVACC